MAACGENKLKTLGTLNTYGNFRLALDDLDQLIASAFGNGFGLGRFGHHHHRSTVVFVSERVANSLRFGARPADERVTERRGTDRAASGT